MALRTIETFRFGGRDDADSIVVSVSEVAGDGMGLHLWPAGVFLADYLFENRSSLREKVILELGAGVGLPGIVAGKCGAKRVVLTDLEKEGILANTKASVAANGLADRIDVQPLTWGLVDASWLHLPEPDLVIAADCLYDEREMDNVCATLAFFLQGCDGARRDTPLCIIAVHDRSTHDIDLTAALERWRLDAELMGSAKAPRTADCANWIARRSLDADCSVMLFAVTSLA